MCCLNFLFCCSVAKLCSTLQPHGLQHARPPCPSPTSGVYSNSWPLSQWWHPTISSLVVPFSSMFPSIRVFSNESALCIRWPKYWCFSFNISSSNEYSGLISFRMDSLVSAPCSPRDPQESFPTPQFKSITLLVRKQLILLGSSSLGHSNPKSCVPPPNPINKPLQLPRPHILVSMDFEIGQSWLLTRLS